MFNPYDQDERLYDDTCFETSAVGLTALLRTFHHIQNWTDLSRKQVLSYSGEVPPSQRHYGDSLTADPFGSLIKNLPEDIKALDW